jgi:REP element-mobilizing transposase RayT
MPYWRLYYHFVWATKQRLPLITPEVEDVLFGYLIGKAHAVESIVHAVGGTDDHLHLVASVPPSLALSDFVARLKGSSSHYLNEALEDAFAWQDGYGVVSFGEKQLKWVVGYTSNQKQHHSDHTIESKLEEIAAESDGPSPTVFWSL